MRISHRLLRAIGEEVRGEVCEERGVKAEEA